MIRLILLAGIIWATGVSVAVAAPATASKQEIAWQPWSESIFERAKKEHKFVLLDLQAVWCHWCHVMDETTYADPKVVALIQLHFLAVRVDQDSRPDLANRYQDYGWPATIVFDADGGEIVKRQGYLPPDQMASILQAIIDDPTPGPSVTNEKKAVAGSAQAGSASLRRQLTAGYDAKLGGWGTDQKFLNWDNVEYCLVQAQAGDAAAAKMAQQTLTAQLKLIDPVWGGVDQYSAGDDWDHPHFEKIMQMQAENIRIYAKAYGLWKDPVHLKTALGIYGYVRRFLTSPDGVVYTSQDADLIAGEHGGEYFKLDGASRRKLGIPRVDQNIYARENGWFILALADLYAVTGDGRYRDEAVRAAQWIIENRGMDGGGFRHGEAKGGPVSLGDSLAMARAFLNLYTITGDEDWLQHAERTAGFIQSRFVYRSDGKATGYATASDESATSRFKPEPDFDENVYLTRFGNLLFHYTGKERDREMALTALRFCGATEVATSRLSSVGALILAESELASDPLHIAIVGRKDDATASQLHEAALAFPVCYKQVEWLGTGGKTMIPDADIYPKLPRSAGYVCTNHSCSAPVFDAQHLVELLQRRTAPK